MKLLTAKTRITIGLACLVFSVLCTAMMIGLMPDPRAGILDGRGKTCESIAISSSDFISRGELKRLEFFLQSVVERNDDIVSAAVRQANGKLVAEIGNHAVLWDAQEDERSTATHVHVPIRSGTESWGEVELRFKEVGESGIAGWFASPWINLSAFVTATSYLLFFFYLSKMLKHLDPGKSVPKRVRAALDSLAEGLLVIDRNDRIVLANQAFATWVSRAPEKLIGVQATKLAWRQDENGGKPETYPWVEALRQEKAQAGFMLGLEQKNAPTRVLMANASPVLGHDGKYQGVLVSFDDVTQLEETKRDLSVAKREAEDASQAKSEFLARMSHEIRTPMNAILGYTDVLRRGFDESMENRQEYLNTIHNSGEHLLALINDILDLSKVESGQMELELERCSPHKLISQVVTLLSSKAQEKGIFLRFECDQPLPETILTDSVRFRQTITNLAGNAIKFTEQGGVTIAARMETTASGGSQPTDSSTNPASRSASNPEANAHGSPVLAIDVIDTGIGIPQAAQAKIFDPFAQADTSVTRRFGGTGLGLAISRQLAEAMGGGIEIASEAGKGSTFTVVIDTGPLDGVEMVDAEKALAVEAKKVSKAKEVRQLPPSRILVADDGESNRKLVELVLSRAGAKVVSVENGQQAVDAAQSESFDLILMDMQMPVMDGYTATRTLRQANYQQPIIALTAHAMRGDEEKCLAAGCSSFLTKPIDIDRLVATLAEILNANESHPATTCAEGLESADDQTYQLQVEVNDLAASARDAAGGNEDDLTDSLTVDYSKPEDEHEPTAGEDSVRNERREVLPAVPATADEPISCSLPLDDPDFLEIAHVYLRRLKDKVAEMQRAWSEKDLSELASLAHWLKGSGGTAGFGVFTEPAIALQTLAKSGDADRIDTALQGLIEMTNRIVLPALDNPNREADARMAAERSGNEDGSRRDLGGQGDPILSTLPTDDADFREIVEEFVARLEQKLAAMEDALSSNDLDELAQLAHWLKGSGGTAGFDAFTAPARELETSAKQANTQAIPSAVAELRDLARRIVVPRGATI